MKANQALVTDDSKAALSFPFEGKKLRLICVSHPQARENTRATISLNDQALPNPHHGEHVHMNDKGLAVMEINKTSGMYELIDAEMTLRGPVQINFLNAVENPLILYEFRSA